MGPEKTKDEERAFNKIIADKALQYSTKEHSVSRSDPGLQPILSPHENSDHQKEPIYYKDHTGLGRDDNAPTYDASKRPLLLNAMGRRKNEKDEDIFDFQEFTAKPTYLVPVPNSRISINVSNVEDESDRLALENAMNLSTTVKVGSRAVFVHTEAEKEEAISEMQCRKSAYPEVPDDDHMDIGKMKAATPRSFCFDRDF